MAGLQIDPETMSDDEKRLHEALDTALLKAYAFRRKGTHLDAFVSKQNFVHLEDSVEFLMTHKLYHVVALLYKGHGDANNALAVRGGWHGWQSAWLVHPSSVALLSADVDEDG